MSDHRAVARRLRPTRSRRTIAVVVAAALVGLAGCSSSSDGGGSTTTTAREGRFEVALVTSTSALPCSAGQYRGPSASGTQSCLTHAGPIIRNADIVKAQVVYEPGEPQWVINATLTGAAAKRLADLARANPAGGPPTLAVVMDAAVLATPVLHSGLTTRAMQISTGRLTRSQAIALATRITGHAPTDVESAARAANDLGTKATLLCRQQLSRTPGAEAVSIVSPSTAGKVATLLKKLGRDARPWSQLPADDFVAMCGYLRASTAQSIQFFVDAAGHRSTVPQL